MYTIFLRHLAIKGEKRMRRDKRICGKDKGFVLFFFFFKMGLALYTLIRRTP